MYLTYFFNIVSALYHKLLHTV